MYARGPRSFIGKKQLIILIVLFILLGLTLSIASRFSGKSGEDARRTADMKEIAAGLALYAKAHNGMYPEALGVLVLNGYLKHEYQDPTTHQPYFYLLSGRADYSVCTTFSTGAYRCVSAHDDGDI